MMGPAQQKKVGDWCRDNFPRLLRQDVNPLAMHSMVARDAVPKACESKEDVLKAIVVCMEQDPSFICVKHVRVRPQEIEEGGQE